MSTDKTFTCKILQKNLGNIKIMIADQSSRKFYWNNLIKVTNLNLFQNYFIQKSLVHNLLRYIHIVHLGLVCLKSTKLNKTDEIYWLSPRIVPTVCFQNTRGINPDGVSLRGKPVVLTSQQSFGWFGWFLYIPSKNKRSSPSGFWIMEETLFLSLSLSLLCAEILCLNALIQGASH